MDKIKVVVVDDSPFSVSVISGMLVQNGYDVVGSAESFEEVIKVVRETKPDLVTMDMALPETDGFECICAVHGINPETKIVVVSSMKDDEIEEEAARLKVSAYVQKPVVEEELLAAVETAISGFSGEDHLYNELQQEYFEVFKNVLQESVYKMTKKPLAYESEYIWKEGHTAEDMAVSVGIAGKFPGKMLIELSNSTAEMLAASILKRELKDDDEAAIIISEFSNIVSGNACSILNKKNKAYGFRVSPPLVVNSKDMFMAPPNFTTHTAMADTAFGKILLNVGFKRSE